MGRAVKQTLPSFDELVALAKTNPERFEQFRHEKCEEMIQSASKEMQGRLRAQQSHIDLVISHCKNPNHVNVVLQQELHRQMDKFQAALTQLSSPLVQSSKEQSSSTKRSSPKSSSTDNVIQFRPNHSTRTH